MDGRKNNKGTVGNNGGRKPKAEEQKLIEKLTPLEEIAFVALKNALVDEESWAVKLFFDYKFGKPKESRDITTNGDSISIPLIDWIGED